MVLVTQAASQCQSVGQSTTLFQTEMSRKLLDGLPRHFPQTVVVSEDEASEFEFVQYGSRNRNGSHLFL